MNFELARARGNAAASARCTGKRTIRASLSAQGLAPGRQNQWRGSIAALAVIGDNGLVAPGIFLPLLESAGLMPAIGAWVLRQRGGGLSRLAAQGLPPMRVAVNISPLELRRRNIAREILGAHR